MWPNVRLLNISSFQGSRINSRGPVLSQVSEQIYPDALCAAADENDSHWVGTMFCDEMYLHAMFSATTAFMARHEHPGASSQSSFHSVAALRLLRARFYRCSGRDVASDSTILTIFVLAMSAALDGDPSATERHLRGLDELVKLRGGLESLKINVQELLSKIYRFVLVVSL
jgi:hypothetical protein